jgi:virginiamycin B lyase
MSPSTLHVVPLAALTLLAGVPARAAEPAVEIREWPVPWEDTRPRDPFVGPEGDVWFVGQRGDYVGVLEPTSGRFERFDLEDGSGPHNLIVADSGTVWVAGNRAAWIGRLDPETGALDAIPMPDPEAGDPHTLTFGRRGEIWFTVQHAGFVGRLDPSTKDVELVKLPTPGSRPYGIAVDGAGRPWIAEFGGNRIATVDPDRLSLREYDLPEASRPRRIAVVGDRVWYVDYGQGRLGRLDPATGEVTVWTTPSGEGSLPYALAVDDRGRPWFVETGPQPNLLVGFDPETESFTPPTPIPSGGSTVRHMVFHEPTGTIWFGTDKNTIGRATVRAVPYGLRP